MTNSVKSESKTLAKHSLIYGLGAATNNLVAFLLLPIYTQYFTAYEYGIKELVGFSTDIIGTLMATAISSAFYRFYFEYKEGDERNLVLSSSYLFLGGFGLIFIALLSFFTPIMAKYVLDSSDLYMYFQISLISLWFQTLNGIGFNFLRAELQSLRFVILSLIKLLLVVCLNIYFIIFLHMGVFGILLSTLISSVVLFFLLNIPQLLRVGLRFSPSLIKGMLIFGFPMILSQAGAFIVHFSDRFFIRAYCSITDAGLYSLGYRFGTLPGTFISEPFNQVWQPRRLELYKQRDSEEIFGTIFTYFLMLITFVGLGVAVLTKEILMIISANSFWSAYKVVPILVIANIIFTFHYHFNIGLIIEKKTKYFAYINISNGGFVLLLNFLLIPRYGIIGAAYATLIGFLYKILLTYVFSSKYFKIYFEVKRIIKLISTAFLIYIISTMLTFDSIVITIFIKTCMVFLLPFILYFIRFYTEKEVEIVKQIVIKYRHGT